MYRQLQLTTKLEMHAMIRFLQEKRCNCREIYRQLHKVYGENAMSRQAIAKWCDIFENGLTDIDNAECEARPSTDAINSEIAARMNECMLASGHVRIYEIF